MRFIGSIFKYIWRIINGLRVVILNIIFFALLVGFIAVLVSEEDPVEVPDNSVLVLNPHGILVEEQTYRDPVDQFFNRAFGADDEIPEVLLSDVIDAIEKAKTDDRIGALYLDLSALYPSGVNKLQAVGEALSDFKTSKKPIIAAGDYFEQYQYYLASYADKVYLNPLGSVAFDGFDYSQVYFKELLDKLKVKPHVFKVGTYKAAVEPFIRNSMSDEAREANEYLYDAMWENFKADVTAQRQLSDTITSGQLDDYMAAFESANGDMAQMALDTNLVDALKTRTEIRNELINLSGYDEDAKTFRNIGFSAYITEPDEDLNPLAESKKDQIAVVVARGQIVNGTQRAGMIGGDSTAALLRKAGEDERTKAVVLRIDSPGGSGFASEIIRQEVLQLKEKGIPVIASMSSVAASGGYWIAAEADEIWAAPTTITGSIGVFGLVMTLEDSAAAIGVHSDSVSTTEIESLNTLEGISDSQARILQRSTENFYQFFITMVAEARNMTPEAVDNVAQGRIWTGRQALERGLVDNLGDFDDAIQAAAKRAELTDYAINTVTQDLSPQQQFFAEFMGQSNLSWPFASSEQNWLVRNVRHVISESEALQNFNDPKNIYTYCALCVQPR